MDFKAVTKLILKGFEKDNVRYALIGGFALSALGIPRSTVDIDFLVHRDDLPKVDKLMRDNGYECVFKTENVSQYVSPVRVFGEVDFLHAFRKASAGMLERAVEKDIFEGELRIRVLKPEDIIGLKLQAIANDKNRTAREYADIEELLKCHKKDADWNLIEEYFAIFGQMGEFLELKGKYGSVK